MNLLIYSQSKGYKERWFSSCHERGTKKKFWVPMRNQTSDLRISRSDALPLSHRDSTVSEVYFEVHMTRVLHTARISNVDSVMFVDGNKRDGKFWARLVTSVGQRKNSESPWGLRIFSGRGVRGVWKRYPRRTQYHTFIFIVKRKHVILYCINLHMHLRSNRTTI